jgi:hypothetical protein
MLRWLPEILPLNKMIPMTMSPGHDCAAAGFSSDNDDVLRSIASQALFRRWTRIDSPIFTPFRRFHGAPREG